jgi:hypothetical protein
MKRVLKQTVSEKTIHPVITSMTANSLGLKVGVKYGNAKGQSGFVPILGWVAVGNYIEAGTAALAPVIKGARNYPMLASPATVKGYVGLFPVEAIVDDIAALPPRERPV